MSLQERVDRLPFTIKSHLIVLAVCIAFILLVANLVPSTTQKPNVTPTPVPTTQVAHDMLTTTTRQTYMVFDMRTVPEINDRDKQGMAELFATGRLVTLPKGTQVLRLDYKDGWWTVRVQSSAFAGTKGYVSGLDVIN